MQFNFEFCLNVGCAFLFGLVEVLIIFWLFLAIFIISKNNNKACILRLTYFTWIKLRRKFIIILVVNSAHVLKTHLADGFCFYFLSYCFFCLSEFYDFEITAKQSKKYISPMIKFISFPFSRKQCNCRIKVFAEA